MFNYRIPAGTDIYKAVNDMVDLANIRQEAVSSDFNGIGLIAEPGTDPDLLQQFWQSEQDRRAEEYRDSPEGQRAAADAEQRRLDMQAGTDQLMEELPNLNFEDPAELIDWMNRLTHTADHVGVSVPRETVIATFREHGFESNVFTGDNFDGEDKENYARYLIGQGLGCLMTVGSIHPIFHTRAKEWREKFTTAV